jgi:hypothetical protein
LRCISMSHQVRFRVVRTHRFNQPRLDHGNAIASSFIKALEENL